MKSNEVIEVSNELQLVKGEYGGDWYGLKHNGREVESILFRDCRHLGNGCDYEVVHHKNGELDVYPITEGWFDGYGEYLTEIKGDSKKIVMGDK
jgi:hypothetical protein